MDALCCHLVVTSSMTSSKPLCSSYQEAVGKEGMSMEHLPDISALHFVLLDYSVGMWALSFPFLQIRENEAQQKCGNVT